MSALPTPTARRLTKPSWKDTRLLVGILLVLLSIVIGAVAMSAADDRVGMWAAAGPLTPGQTIEEGDLQRVDVQLGDAQGDYLMSNERLPNGAVVDREVREGELVPRAAVVNPTELDVQRVAVHVDPAYLSNLVKGSRVTVFTATPQAKGEDAPAGSDEPEYEEFIRRATVHELPRSGGVMSSGSRSSVIIVVPADKVTELLSRDTRDTPIRLAIEAGSPEARD
ncbi:SAF domain-containing protein [Janibacter sp. CX7]|uniref:SAF domain-containing protein n=1 Tax=Janibacter sp. CX7 TaxID=2963431 RepID=UPI0020CDE9FB|nr:SAF domain-containing protein [Janibacter sp. CX7]UTT65263.1 SAF domain-containing protein [Janibacter sp. CX7]